MNQIRTANRLKLVNSRKVKSSVAYPFSKTIRNFFSQNNLGKTEVVYFQKALKSFGNENIALMKLKRFVKLPFSEREQIVRNEFELESQMSFRLGEGGKKRPLRTQPKKKRKA